MSCPPVGEDTTLGYQPPRNTQFSVFLDNRVGKLLELLEVFSGQALTMAAFSIHNQGDCAVVRLLTSREELARRLLERHHFPFSECDMLVTELGPGQSLADLCKCLLQAEVSVCYVYPLIRTRGQPAIALRTDDQTLAGQILRRKLYVLLGENDLGENATPGA